MNEKRFAIACLAVFFLPLLLTLVLTSNQAPRSFGWVSAPDPTPWEMHCRQVKAYNLTQPMPHARIYGCP